MRYAIVIEKAEGNYSAYVRDFPGCVAAGPTVEAVEQEIRDAIRFHIDGLKADGLPVRRPRALGNLSQKLSAIASGLASTLESNQALHQQW